MVAEHTEYLRQLPEMKENFVLAPGVRGFSLWSAVLLLWACGKVAHHSGSVQWRQLLTSWSQKAKRQLRAGVPVRPLRTHPRSPGVHWAPLLKSVPLPDSTKGFRQTFNMGLWGAVLQILAQSNLFQI